MKKKLILMTSTFIPLVPNNVFDEKKNHISIWKTKKWKRKNEIKWGSAKTLEKKYVQNNSFLIQFITTFFLISYGHTIIERKNTREVEEKLNQCEKS